MQKYGFLAYHVEGPLAAEERCAAPSNSAIRMALTHVRILGTFSAQGGERRI
jgi:hypothetical protein